jgi:prepilin-type N-terminal cleavage/methylation domain-containing protein
MSSKSKSGFTIVEILVVIAIILFLVALLMPALQRVKETAKLTKCISNLRQISMATFMYAADNEGLAPYDDATVAGNDEYFTPRSHDVSHSSYSKTYPKNKWFAEYLSGGELGKMNRIAYCPSGGRFGERGPNVPSSDKKGAYPNVSYGMNAYLVEDDWFAAVGSNYRDCTPLAQVPNPAKAALWVESVRNKPYHLQNALSGRHFSPSREIYVDRPAMDAYTIYRNFGQMNVVFVDQHIRTIKIPEEYPYWACIFWRPQNVNIRGLKCSASNDCKWCEKGNNG